MNETVVTVIRWFCALSLLAESLLISHQTKYNFNRITSAIIYYTWLVAVPIVAALLLIFQL